MSIIVKQIAKHAKNSALRKAKFWKSINQNHKRCKWVKAALINRHVEQNA